MWPKEGLETLGKCPICGSDERHHSFAGLTDSAFFCAPGEWSLWRCQTCRSAYLDPRPTPETIHLAYANYFTHGQPTVDRGRLPSFRGWLVQHYQERKAGHPASVFAALLLRLRPSLRQSLDYGLRYLSPPRRRNNRLLDVGCGNGAFLIAASRLRWQAVGCDFDAAAVERAQALGFDVRLGGPQILGAGESFDYVTLSHVIEHVHDPLEFLRSIRRVMKPSAQLFIDTPNADALGFERFGPHWRGLEAPRHLALFNWESLEFALKEAGFRNIERRPQVQVCHEIWKKSARIEAGFSPYDERAVLVADVFDGMPPQGEIDSARSEFVTVTATY